MEKKQDDYFYITSLIVVGIIIIGTILYKNTTAGRNTNRYNGAT